MRKVLCCAGAIAGAVLAVGTSAAMADQYVVLYKQGASTAAAHQAIRDAGGTIVSENTDVGVATVSSSDPSFVKKADGEAALDGAARNQVIGHVPGASTQAVVARRRDRARATSTATGRARSRSSGDPLGGLQWDMQMIGATPTGSYAHDRAATASASASWTRASTAATRTSRRTSTAR